MANWDGCFYERIKMVIEEVARDLAPGGEPYPVMAGDVGERILEGLQAIRLADEVGMQRDAHHRARVLAFLVQAVELAPDDLAVVARRHRADIERDGVVHLERVGDAGEAPFPDLHRAGLVVVEEIADIGEAHLGDEIERALGVGERGGEPAVELLAGHPPDGVDRILDQRALLRLAHAEGVAGVVGAVRIELPAALDTGLDHFRVVLAYRDVERHAAAHAAAVHRLRHAPEAGAVAVVAVRVVDDIRDRPRPRGARRVLRRVELVELDVRRDPERHARAVRPNDLRPPVVGQVVVEPGVPLHSFFRYSRTSETGRTSAYLSAMS